MDLKLNLRSELSPNVLRSSVLVILIMSLLVPAYLHGQNAPWYEGITHPILDSILGSPNDGVIGNRYFDEGDEVEKGEIILELSTDIERLDVERRQVALTLSGNELSRLKQLSEKTSSVSGERLETVEGNYSIAKADFELAKARLRDRQVIAPFSGIIADFLQHEVGEGTKVGDPLMRLVDTSRILLVCNLPAKVAGHLEKGQKLPVRGTYPDPEKVIQGEITFISPVVDAASGLLRVKLVIPNQDRIIRPGVIASVQIQ